MKLWCGLESNDRPIGLDWEYYCDLSSDTTIISNFCKTYLSINTPEVISVDTNFFHIVNILHNLGRACKELDGVDLIFKIHIHDGDTLIRNLVATSPYLEEVPIIIL